MGHSRTLSGRVSPSEIRSTFTFFYINTCLVIATGQEPWQRRISVKIAIVSFVSFRGNISVYHWIKLGHIDVQSQRVGNSSYTLTLVVKHKGIGVQ